MQPGIGGRMVLAKTKKIHHGVLDVHVMVVFLGLGRHRKGQPHGRGRYHTGKGQRERDLNNFFHLLRTFFGLRGKTFGFKPPVNGWRHGIHE